MAEEGLFNFSLKTPASISIIGPSMCGKTHLILDIIRNRNLYFDRVVTKVIYVYYRINETLLELATSDPNVILVEDILEADKLIEDSCLVIIDDQLGQLNNRQINELVTDYFIRKVHHLNFNVIITLQRAFSSVTKTILDNTKYAAYFNNPRYKALITHVAKNFAPRNIRFVQEAYAIATRQPHGYLLFDFSNDTPEEYRLRNKIFPNGDDTLLFRSQ